MLSPASPPSEEEWSQIDQRVARSDEDRWISSRYAPRRERRALIALYALNVELARVRTVASEPGLGAIRFQWWRDALDEIRAGGPVRKHDVVQVIAASIQAGAYPSDALLRLVDGHEDAFETGDQGKEPEGLLMALACCVLTERHGWRLNIEELAPAYAAARRGDSKAFGPILPRVPSVIRPAIAHARLRGAYSEGKLPGRLMRRFIVLRAMISGRV